MNESGYRFFVKSCPKQTLQVMFPLTYNHSNEKFTEAIQMLGGNNT